MASKESKEKKDSNETSNIDVKTPIKFKFIEGMFVFENCLLSNLNIII